MLAAVYGNGSTELTLREVPTPEPGPGMVRVRVAVSGVNPTDWKTRKGVTSRSPAPADGFQIPNLDGAGTIDAVGDGVDESRIGERVWLLMAAHNSRFGTAAQYTVVPGAKAIALPDSASFELGASLGVPALTAACCLAAHEPLAGATVLVSGGAGAVGHAAIELARFEHAGHIVATVSGPEKAALAHSARADTVVNYRDAGAAEQIRDAVPGGVDRFVEVALDHNLELDLAVAAPHALITAYGADPQTVAHIPVRRLMAGNVTLRFMVLYTVTPAQLSDAIERTTRALCARALTTLPLRRFTLAQAAEAHDAVEGGALGKVLIDLP